MLAVYTRPLRRYAALALLLGVTGCVPAMTDPPPLHDNGAGDPRLVGTWLSGGDDPGFTFIGGEGGAMRAVLVNVLENGRLEVDEFEFFRARSLNGDLLMVTEADEDEGRYLPVQYRFDGDNRFRIRWLSIKPVKLAVERGELQGRVVKGRWIDEVVITAPHAEALAWIESHEDAWDSEHGIWFNRVDDVRVGCLVNDEKCPR